MPNTVRFRHIDAFAARPFEGNSAAVYRADAFPPDDLMLKIAREHNLSETAWVVPDDSGEADYQLRWFTPAVEVEMCGHATLASGHAVLTEEPGRDEVRFRTLRGAGILSVARDGDGYAMNLPSWPCEVTEYPAFAASLGQAPDEVRVTQNAAEDSFLAIYADAARVRALAPDFAAMGKLGNYLFIATAPGDALSGSDVVSRVFAPGAGIDEDPVTGSAHAILTPYWAGRLGRPSFTAHQASERGGHIHCTLESDRAILRGTCVDVIEGVLLV
ncbi:PhzF family phenazine biosynthesis protein [Pacificimonas sp. WHA3]|uniref:PhzF family phenazine biosynthesis protein n=1 Tax=Pacificimonas pallii TaxID=2827236 RepID=A0ABS6SDC0_9SPHN|nr:PhzF family phenazine biosynthesis protein [Pacificimonas pallii]MBV7256417.1 PhzF family phenazine biosynthesis protein [Pacificimonas pallii]